MVDSAEIRRGRWGKRFEVQIGNRWDVRLGLSTALCLCCVPVCRVRARPSQNTFSSLKIRKCNPCFTLYYASGRERKKSSLPWVQPSRDAAAGWEHACMRFTLHKGASWGTLALLTKTVSVVEVQRSLHALQVLLQYSICTPQSFDHFNALTIDLPSRSRRERPI